jgi:hypothetical protein
MKEPDLLFNYAQGQARGDPVSIGTQPYLLSRVSHGVRLFAVPSFDIEGIRREAVLNFRCDLFIWKMPWHGSDATNASKQHTKNVLP